MITVSGFKSVISVLDFFNSKEKCVSFLEQQRWVHGIHCPHCGHAKIYRTNRGFKCANRDCHRKFSAISGTVFENTKIELRYWFAAIYLLSAHKKGISSHQLARDLGICQKTAWFLNHRVRIMMTAKSVMLNNTVEVDETFIGGKNKNRHKNKKVENSQGRSVKDKTPVVGLIERGGKLITMKAKNTKGATLVPIVKQNVTEGATVMTDEWGGYNKLRAKFDHMVINHKLGEYVNGDIHTNTIENYWSLFKRGIIGIYHHISEKHLDRYCDEFAYRFNSRELNDRERFENTLTKCNRRLSWNDLVYGEAQTIDVEAIEVQTPPTKFSSMKEFKKLLN